MVYLESRSHDPCYNLAFEQYVFDFMPRENSYFLLWQNENSLIVGKHQNTAEEINAGFVREHGIRVARRLSGGGAVYHDLGNLNYTIITDAGDMERLNLQAFCIPLVTTLRRIGVDARITGRNDVTIGGAKCSGSSQYIKQGRIMHHGCILFDSDLSMIEGALNVPKDKIESKGLRSVRSRVTNIRPHIAGDMDMRGFMELLKRHMFENELKPAELDEAAEVEINRLREERYSTWEWTFGSSPQYSIRKERRVENCGRIEVSMNVARGGTITEFTCHGDFFGSGDIEDIARILIGKKLEETELRGVLNGCPLDLYFSGLGMDELINILLQ